MPGRVGATLDWDKLRVFHAVAEAGSFTHAGDTLNLSQSAVSRQISSLESSLNTPLFHRHARGLILTEQGDLLYRTVHEVFAKLAMVEAHLIDTRERTFGPLRVTSAVAFGSLWLTSRVKEFIEEYPDIEVEIILDDGELDLTMREADIGIRFKPPTQQDLIQRVLRTNHYLVFAAPEYLKKHGMPKDIADLDKHAIIAFSESAKQPVEGLNWLLDVGREDGGRRKPILTVNSIYGIFRAVQSGLGIAALPDYFAYESNALVQILPEARGPSFDAYLVYPEELRSSKRIRVFADFVKSKLSEMDR